ncbi:MAG: hypothetical protein AB1444_08900 [Spirochaetota bacterium]
MYIREDIIKIINECDRVLNLINATLGEEYYYQSLPLCVIDSVWSLGVKYESVKQVVSRYCKYFKLKRIRENRYSIPPKEDQESISNFFYKMSILGVAKFTDEIFGKRQRTSTKNGILKTEAVFQFATVLKKYKVDYFQDLNKIVSNTDFEADIKKIPGQSSGISLKYFLMLAGEEDLIKPDRMIVNFLYDITGKNITAYEAQLILVHVCNGLKCKYPHLTPRLLDHIIWNYKRMHNTISSTRRV